MQTIRWDGTEMICKIHRWWEASFTLKKKNQFLQLTPSSLRNTNINGKQIECRGQYPIFDENYAGERDYAK